MQRASNGWTDNPAMAPRPFKKCPECSKPLAGGETRCQTCAQTEKGLGIQGPPGGDATQVPFELSSPRPELEGGKAR